MKTTSCVLGIALLLAACQQPSKSASNEAFEKNSATLAAYLKSFQDKKPDYSGFADNYWALNTLFGVKSDTVTLEQMKESDRKFLEMFDLKLAGDSIVFLPGVSSSTKMPDGSVRYYASWRVTRHATDSTKEKSAVLKLYESYDFDDNGKIAFSQIYGDFSAAMNYLTSK